MSLKKTSFVILLLIAASGALYVHKPDLLRKYLPKSWVSALRLTPPREIPGSYIGNTITANDWASPEDLSNKLLEMIDQRLEGTSVEQVQNFLKNPENRLILAQHALVKSELDAADARNKANESYQKTLDDLRRQVEDSTRNLPKGTPLPPKIAARNERIQARIAAIESEMTAPHTVASVLASGKSEKGKPSFGATFVEQVSNNLDWVEQFVNSGERTDVGSAFATMEKIARKNPEMMFNELYRDTATATAIEFARSGWTQDDAVNRALFYMKNHKAGRLNKVFDTLPIWLRRNVCGLKGKGIALGAGGNDKAGSLDSMEYSLDNVHLPAYRYTGSCWQAPYRLHNIYGDSIHGASYHEPFNDVYGNNFNELTRTVGGVCGGLSHYGATTATANGVPAMTCGEPGHCAYIVLVGDRWTPAYSLSWQRGLHWQVFKGNNKYSALHMATLLFSPEQKEQTTLSQAMQNLGNAYAATAPEKSKTFYEQAVQAQPMNYYAWRDYANFLAKTAPGDAAAWSSLCSSVNKLMAPTHPEMAAEMLKAHVYPELKKAMASNPDELKKLMLDFWARVNTMGPDAEWDKGFHGRWDVEGMCQAQLNILDINPQKNPAIQSHFRTLMSSVASKPDYAPVVLSWGNSLLEKMDKNMQSDFMTAMVGGVGQTAGDDNSRESMLRPVILAAEKTGDIKSFQAVGKTLPEKYLNPPAKVAEPKGMPDQLVSRGGILKASSTSNFDNPCNHWGVLEPGVGGGFHTAKDKDAWVMVTLPKQANVTTVFIQTTTGNLHRLNDMVVQVSETGADNDWKEVAQLGKCNKQAITVDLKATAPLAKYVRIVRKGGPEFFHLRSILIYGKPAA